MGRGIALQVIRLTPGMDRVAIANRARRARHPRAFYDQEACVLPSSA